MPDILYDLVKREFDKMPHVSSRIYPLHPPVVGEFELDENDEHLTIHSSQRVNFDSIGQVVVQFATQRTLRLRFPPIQKEALASMADVQAALENVPEIGAPIAADQDFLMYLRQTKRQGRYGPKHFDLVVVGTSNWFNYTYRFETQGMDGMWASFCMHGHPIIGAFAKALRAQYGR